MRSVRTFLWLSVVVLLTACANLPIWTEDEESEVAKGESRHKEILQYAPELANEKLADFVSTIGNKIAAVSDRPSLRWKFTVLDSPVENALATMGGHVYITRGLLVYLRNETELAAVLAHEIAHICRRDAIHADRRAGAGLLVALGLMAAAPATILFPQVVAAPVGMGLSAVRRSDETAADQLAATYLARAGYPAEAMQDALDVLISLEAYKKSTGNLRETFWHRVYAQHPQTTRRQERLAALTGPQSTDAKADVDTKFLLLLEGMEVGNASGDGIPHEGKRYFPELAISLEVPAGWRAQAYRGRHGRPSGVWLTHEKAGAVLIQQHAIVDLTENVCDSMTHTFKTETLEEQSPLRSGQASTCTALGSRTYSLFFSKRTYWERVAIIRLDGEHYVTFSGRIPSQKKDEEEFRSMDQAFLALAKSIGAIPPQEAPDRPRLHIHRAQPGDSFETLAATSHLPADGARFLRAINLRSPDENVATGEVIKIVK